MKNLFKKESNSGFWIAAGLTGLVAAGTAAWYFLKRAAAPQVNEHALDYLKPAPPLHKKKTDLHDLHAIAAVN